MADKEPQQPNINLADLPIVGQSYTRCGWWPVILLRCNCTLDTGGLTIIVLNGLQQPSQCPRCKKMYAAQGFEQTQNGLRPVISVAVEQQVGEA